MCSIYNENTKRNFSILILCFTCFSGGHQLVPAREWTRGVGRDDATAEGEDGCRDQESREPAVETHTRGCLGHTVKQSSTQATTV